MTAQGKSWQQATKCDLDLYYTIRTSGEYQNQPALKDRSWNVAKSAIVHLYEYARDNGFIDSTPFKYRHSKAKFGGKHVETADLSAKYTPEAVNFISITNYQRIWRPLIANGENAQRNLALIDTLIVSGLRISEALNLDVHQLPDPDDQCYAGLKSVTLKVVGKGKKSRNVRIPKRIVRTIRFYCDEERAEILTRAKSNHTRKKSPKQSSKIFLARTGRPLSSRTVESFFAAISSRAGIRLTPHGCRHSFAIYQLDAMIKRMAQNLRELRENGSGISTDLERPTQRVTETVRALPHIDYLHLPRLPRGL